MDKHTLRLIVLAGTAAFYAVAALAESQPWLFAGTVVAGVLAVADWIHARWGRHRVSRN